MKLQKRFHNFLQQTACIPEGSRALVAVSGGADSVALLRLLYQCAESLKLSLVVAHLDHALRAESSEDATFVEELCAGLNLPVVVERQDVVRIVQERKGNLEEVAREVRRDFLERTADAESCDLIVLGQHADDQAETFLMRLLRGAGSAGLAGMQPVNGKIVRPLLNFHRSELVEYLQENEFDWREDASNQDLRFTRNRIRHELLPSLKEFNPNISQRLVELSGRLSQDENFWEKLVAEEMSRCRKALQSGVSLDREKLVELGPALSGRVIRRSLEEVRGDLRGISSVHIENIQTLIADGPVQGELDLPRAWVGRRYDEVVFLEKMPVQPEFIEMSLEKEGCYRLPDGCNLVLSLEKSTRGEHLGAVEFSTDGLTFPLTLRHCLPGDRIRPSGMQGSKKLQDLFVDLKLPHEVRRNTMLLKSGTDVLWIVGLRRCEGYRPEPGKEVLRIALETEIQS